MPLDLTESICVPFDAIAKFLRQNAITTVTGLVALMCSYQIAAPDAERKSYAATTIVILLSTVSVTAVCAFAFYGLKFAWDAQVHQATFAVANTTHVAPSTSAIALPMRKSFAPSRYVVASPAASRQALERHDE